MHASEVKKYWLRQIVVDMNAIYQMTENEPGLYPYFFNHPGQIHQLSGVRVSHIHGFSHVLQLFK